MDKIKIKLNNIENVSFEYNGEIVITKNYISLIDYEMIVNDIRNTIFNSESIINKISFIKLRFNRCVIELLTNIDVSDYKLDDYFICDIVDSLKYYIKNYDDCLNNIMKEYELFVNQINFEKMTTKIPSEDGMKSTIEEMGNLIKGIDTEKLTVLLKSVSFNKMPIMEFVNNLMKQEKTE